MPRAAKKQAEEGSEPPGALLLRARRMPGVPGPAARQPPRCGCPFAAASHTAARHRPLPFLCRLQPRPLPRRWRLRRMLRTQTSRRRSGTTTRASACRCGLSSLGCRPRATEMFCCRRHVINQHPPAPAPTCTWRRAGACMTARTAPPATSAARRRPRSRPSARAARSTSAPSEGAAAGLRGAVPGWVGGWGQQAAVGAVRCGWVVVHSPLLGPLPP